MSTVMGPAQAPKHSLRQAWWFSFSSRRVPVARSIALAAILFLCSSPVSAQKRREAILRLRDDVSTAMAHASLTEKQTQRLDRCQQTLLLSAQSGRARRMATKRDLDSALKDIERLFHGGPFHAEDQELVRQDIDQLRSIERNQRARRYTRARTYLRQVQ
jgi:hypothetical protein